MPTIDTTDPNFLSDFENLSWQVRQYCDAVKNICGDEPELKRHVQNLLFAMQRVEGWVRADGNQMEIDALEELYTGKKKRGPRVISL